MKYDKELKKEFGNIQINYGILEGNCTIFFMKTGQSNSIYGYNDKYIRIAHEINTKYGYTVITASNLFDGRNPLDTDLTVIEEYCNERNFEDYDIHFMGHSNGALVGAAYAYKYPKIKRMLLINLPLINSLEAILNRLNSFKGEKLTLVYGELDGSFKYLPFIKTIVNDSISIITIEGVDHKFIGTEDIFIRLPEEYLFDDRNTGLKQ